MKDAWPYLIAGVVLTLILAATAPVAATAAAGLLTLGVASFFRDPKRSVPFDPSLILSPADGKVVKIQEHAGGQPKGTRCVSIFLSVFNVHVNRSPVEGRVADIKYTPGEYLPAYREKASELNEQNLITLDTVRGSIGVKQIAGLIARRIRCYKRPGERVSQGEKIGFITFGSRVDLYLPAEVGLKVVVGDVVKGGTSVIAVYPS